MRVRTVGLCLAVVMTAALSAIFTGPLSAAGVAPSLIAQYLGRMGVEWKVDTKDPIVLRVTKSAGREMLSKNATAFGAYFVDESGDIGFRYVFTTEDGLG